MKSPVFSRTLFSDHFSSHDEALEEALQRYLATTQPNLRQQALENVAKHLLHPRQILRSQLLTDSHPLHREALIASDAFEAVTNGMHHPNVMEQLETISPESIFLPWKHLILAIHFFYADLAEGVEFHLLRIDSTSPLSKLVPVLRLLLKPEQAQGSRIAPVVLRFLDEIFETDPRWALALEQLTDSLESHMEELFWAALEDLLGSLPTSAEREARSLVLWAWNQMSWQDFDEKRLLEMTASRWSLSEAYRLAALGSLGYDPEGALLLWGRFMIQGMREGFLENSRLEQAWKIFLDFVRATRDFQKEQGTAKDWEKDWARFVQQWELETSLRENTAMNAPSNWVAMVDRYDNLSRSELGTTAMETSRPVTEQSKHIRPKASGHSDGQLDLFGL